MGERRSGGAILARNHGRVTLPRGGQSRAVRRGRLGGLDFPTQPLTSLSPSATFCARRIGEGSGRGGGRRGSPTPTFTTCADHSVVRRDGRPERGSLRAGPWAVEAKGRNGRALPLRRLAPRPRRLAFPRPT